LTIALSVLLLFWPLYCLTIVHRRSFWRHQRSNQRPWIEVEQTIQWSKQKKNRQYNDQPFFYEVFMFCLRLFMVNACTMFHPWSFFFYQNA
jgi:hypothetical protein